MTALDNAMVIVSAVVSMFVAHELGHQIMAFKNGLKMDWRMDGVFLVWDAYRRGSNGERLPMSRKEQQEMGSAGFAASILAAIAWVGLPFGLIVYLVALAAHFVGYAMRDGTSKYDDFNLIRPE